ncbi:hypothetical protein C4D60_Mb04t15240 [Musa balbisiana]|uniref:Uncharacterized protein n=1 Tax=Musa balbisiana TaxID=52838 RepID=A0A4S8KCA1_MUSBA|nr:hypothetical protein C4D60_Mb04t15240 [Musa balbisiana]
MVRGFYLHGNHPVRRFGTCEAASWHRPMKSLSYRLNIGAILMVEERDPTNYHLSSVHCTTDTSDVNLNHPRKSFFICFSPIHVAIKDVAAVPVSAHRCICRIVLLRWCIHAETSGSPSQVDRPETPMPIGCRVHISCRRY